MITKYYEFENIKYIPNSVPFQQNNVRVFSYNGMFSFTPSSDRSYTSSPFMRSFGGQLTANRIYNLPDKSGTLALEENQGLSFQNTLALISLRI